MSGEDSDTLGSWAYTVELVGGGCDGILVIQSHSNTNTNTNPHTHNSTHIQFYTHAGFS